MASDFLNILKELRGTGAPGAAYTDGIYYDITEKATEDDDVTPRLAPGIYESIKVMYEGAGELVPLTVEIQALALITDAMSSLYADKATLDAVYADIIKGLGTNQPTDSAILNALTNATIAGDNAILTAADAVTVAEIYDNFDDRWLGSKDVAPTLDNDGDPLLTGALYWDTVLTRVMVYDGAVWTDALTLTESSTSTLINKTINDVSNTVAANIVHMEVEANSGQTIVEGDVLEAVNIVGDAIVKVQKHSSLGNPVIGIALDNMGPGENGRAMVIGVFNNYDSTGLSLHTVLYPNGTGGLTPTPTIDNGNYNQPIAFVQKISGANADLIVNVHSGHESAELITYDGTTSGLAAINAQDAIDEVEGRLDTTESKLSEVEVSTQIITDWDEAITSGWYYANPSLLNAPTAVAINWNVFVAKGSNLNNIIQIGVARNVNSDMYIRNRNAGVWGAWARSLTTTDEGLLDAGTLDGLDSIQFLRSDTDGATTGSLSVGGEMVSDTLTYVRSKSITADTDLDTITTSGFYDMNVTNAVIANTPSTGWWYLRVQRHTNDNGHVWQELYPLNAGSGDAAYHRRQNATVWEGWKRILDETDLTDLNDADTVNGLTVETAVPVGAVFTDTTYDSTDFVDLTTAQTIAGVKTFSNGVTVTSGNNNGLNMEGGIHQINTNDGGGNFNIRISNDFVTGCTEDGYVAHHTFTQSTGIYNFKVSDASLLIGNVPTWLTPFTINPTGTHTIGNITLSGTVAGRDIATDGAKLDGIEDNATADQTKTDIDALLIDADTVDGFQPSELPVSTATQTALDTKMTTIDYTKAAGNINNPLLDLPLNNSLAMKQGTGAVTFSRASTATYIDRYGVLQYSAIDEPRFEKRGLLIEGSNTNTLTYSSDFSVGWTANQATIVPAATTAPDGTTTAISISDEGNGLISQVVTFTAGETYTLSVFAKAGTTDVMRLTLVDAAFALTSTFNFDLVEGDINTSSGNATGSIEHVGDGWYRCSITDTCTITNSSINTFRINSIGADLGETVYLWGAQLEEDSLMSSYIPTTTTALTRSADICTVDFADNQPRYYEELSMLVDISTLSDTYTANRVGIATSQGLGNGYINNGTTGKIGYSLAGGVITENKVDWTTTSRYGFSSNSSTYATFQDGILSSTGNSVGTTRNTIPTSITIGNSGEGTNFIYGHISNVRIWDKELTAEEMRLA